MADQHLTALSSPEFPQVFDRCLDQLFQRVERILAASYLSTCAFEDQFGDCREVATVHHLKSEHEFCADHFKVISRG